MNIVICSDIHDHISNLKTFFSQLPDAEALIICGDLCSPFILSLIAKAFRSNIHVVFGNNDGDLFRMSQIAASFSHVKLHGEVLDIEIDGKKILANHFPEITAPIAQAGLHDVVCYGHNHTFRIEQINKTWYVNPGTLMGYQPGSDEEVPATFALYDTEAHQMQAFQLGEDELIPMVSIF